MITTSSTGNWRAAVGTGGGTFRGVAFDIKGEQGQNGGRRTVKREFPLRENGGADDLGKRLREYSFNAVIVGEDYLTRRDALIDALDAPGPGELVHPNYGTLQIQVDAWDCKEDTSSGGRAEFSVKFYPPLTTTAPVSTADTAAQTQATADKARNGVFSDFADGWDINDLSLHDLQALIDNATNYVNQITASIQQYFGVLDDLSSIMASATALQGAIGSLIHEPVQLAHRFDQLIGSVQGVANTAGQSFDAYSHMSNRLVYSSNDPTVTESQDAAGNPVPVMAPKPTTVQGRLAARQLSAMVQQNVTLYQTASASDVLTRSVQLSGNSQEAQAAELMASTAAGSEAIAIMSRDDAASVTEQQANALDAAVMVSSDLQWPQAELMLRRLRLVFIADMTARAKLLPGVNSVTLTTTEPVLVMLNRINGSVADWRTFTLRNNIRNPLFLMAGDTYGVTNDSQ